MAKLEHVLPDLGDDIVTVKVGTGDNSKPFFLHKNILCKRSEFFSTCLSGQWKGSDAGPINIPEDDPATFQLYVQSLYVGNVKQAEPEESSEQKFRYLGNVYVLAQKMLDNKARPSS